VSGGDNWRDRGQLFDRAAEDYRDGRPGYPPAAFEILESGCGLRPGCRALEIGAGAGQATLPIPVMYLAQRRD
jgi:hypothetical protein